MIKVFQHGNNADTVVKLEGSNQVIAMELTILIKEVTKQYPEIMTAVADNLENKEVSDGSQTNICYRVLSTR